MATRGVEYGIHAGLDWIQGDVVRLEATADGRGGHLKIPHMGWNELSGIRPHALLAGISARDHAYFVHSYHFRPQERGDRMAVVDYGGPLVAAVARGNLAGVQFHPEKSQAAGLAFLANFLRWRP